MSDINKISIKGSMTKQNFYVVLAHIDELKQEGWYIVNHEREEDVDTGVVRFQYSLEKK